MTCTEILTDELLASDSDVECSPEISIMNPTEYHKSNTPSPAAKCANRRSAVACAGALLEAHTHLTDPEAKHKVIQSVSKLGSAYQTLCSGTAFSVWDKYIDVNSEALDEAIDIMNSFESRAKSLERGNSPLKEGWNMSKLCSFLGSRSPLPPSQYLRESNRGASALSSIDMLTQFHMKGYSENGFTSSPQFELEEDYIPEMRFKGLSFKDPSYQRQKRKRSSSDGQSVIRRLRFEEESPHTSITTSVVMRHRNAAYKVWLGERRESIDL